LSSAYSVPGLPYVEEGWPALSSDDVEDLGAADASG
jgi:hypothetical protein